MTIADGRVTRGARNRTAIIDAVIACYEAGVLRPSVPEVAARAGVSVRSVHNHFDDVETLRGEVAQRQWHRYAPRVRAVSTVEELVDTRADVYEAIAPVRRAALLTVHDSPMIAGNLARADQLLRRQLEELFPGLAPENLDALELVTSWDAWNRLRTAQGCSAERARAVMLVAIRQLTQGELG